MAKKEARQPTESTSAELPAMDWTEGDLRRPLKRKEYRQALAELQLKLFGLQEWVAAESSRLLIVLEGLGPAGKRGAGHRIAEGLDQRICKVVNLDSPTKRERGQWHFQRYVEHFPTAGRIAIFDGSWYHIPIIERALGLYSDRDFAEFLRQCNEFEQMLARSGILLVKYWFSAEDDEQERRFREHIASASKREKAHWASQTQVAEPAKVLAVRQNVISNVQAPNPPWCLIQTNDRRRSRLMCISDLLTLIPRQEKPADTDHAAPPVQE